MTGDERTTHEPVASPGGADIPQSRLRVVFPPDLVRDIALRSEEAVLGRKAERE